MDNLYYYFSQDKDLNYYSCDMVRIKFELYNNKDCINEFEKYINDVTRIDIKHFPINVHDLKYKNMLTITYENGAVLKLGFCFNGYVEECKRMGFIEFNPNKCYCNDQCRDDVFKIKQLSWNFELVRWDLAIDMQINREYVSMAKDRRKYELIMYSKENKTESLGERNKEGRVKLYNKTIESDLDYDLTRLEMTLGNIDNLDETIYRKYEPDVYVFGNQKELDFSDLSSTQKVLVELMTDSDNPAFYFKKLSANIQVKLRPYIFRDSYKIKTDYKSVVKIMKFIKTEILFDNK